jgi:fructuronate reductase
MDNMSGNGDIVKKIIFSLSENELSFVSWLKTNVSFPLSMIDKITPHPARAVRKMLSDLGVEDMDGVETAKGTIIAPFVNAEVCQYLVIENNFPNSRPPLEKAGVLLTDAQTVRKCEQMKVTTCLNPLHTVIAPFACLLNIPTIWEAMGDPDIKELVYRAGFGEGLPVVQSPGILDPKAFLTEVLEVRFPNPAIPDTPERIMVDTSQKMPVVFGETMKAYESNPEALFALPLAIAGWLRYLLGIDDNLDPIPTSDDPRALELKKLLQTIPPNKEKLLSDAAIQGSDLEECVEIGQAHLIFPQETAHTDPQICDRQNLLQGNDLSPWRKILGDKSLFGLSLENNVIGKRVRLYYDAMTHPGGVRKTLHTTLQEVGEQSWL